MMARAGAPGPDYGCGGGPGCPRCARETDAQRRLLGGPAHVVLRRAREAPDDRDAPGARPALLVPPDWLRERGDTTPGVLRVLEFPDDPPPSELMATLRDLARAGDRATFVELVRMARDGATPDAAGRLWERLRARLRLSG